MTITVEANDWCSDECPDSDIETVVELDINGNRKTKHICMHTQWCEQLRRTEREVEQ